MVRATALRVAAGAVILATLPGAALAESFNLTCTGNLRTLAPYARIDKTEPYSYVYHIDLDAKKWCEGSCLATKEIAEISPVIITLEKKLVDTPREHDETSNLIFRQTGAHTIMADSGVGMMNMSLFWKGQCEKSEFTGFPKVGTKF